MVSISDSIVKNIISRVINNQDYRIEVISLINAMFMDFAIDFFKQVAEAKLNKQSITSDWYKAEFLNPTLPSRDIIINSGLNHKTVVNMYNSATREIVLDASQNHYDQLYEAINHLVENGTDIDITLSIKLNGVSVDLNINESLIVINTLAVKRAEIRGGAWSSAGKRVEKPLMLTLCTYYGVPSECYELTGLTEANREVDFYLIDKENRKYLCEVKLMGRGNPESADSTIARDSRVFVADKLSQTNKDQLSSRGVYWVELRSKNGYTKFEQILKQLGIPYKKPTSSLEDSIGDILNQVLSV